MISHGKDLKIFCGNSNRPLAEAICKELRLPLGELDCGSFSDGECFVGFDANGNLRTHEETYSDVRYNVFFHPLEEILQVREALAPT